MQSVSALWGRKPELQVGFEIYENAHYAELREKGILSGNEKNGES